MQQPAFFSQSPRKQYFDRRFLFVFVFGCSSGFPWVIIGSCLSAWLHDIGVSLPKIGYLGSVFTVYSINFLWSPFLDRYSLSRRLGRRRSWILLCQIAIAMFTFFISMMPIEGNLLALAGVSLGIAFFSATQDIAIDGFRIDAFDKSEHQKIPAASAMATIGWWTGYSLPGFFAFHYADIYGWPNMYLGLVGITLGLAACTLLIRDNGSGKEVEQAILPTRPASTTLQALCNTLMPQLEEFFQRNGVRVATTLLGFIFLFKIGEAFLGRMSVPFYKDIGFTNAQIAEYSKLIGWGSTTVFTIISAFINIRLGIVKGLLIGGLAMAGSNFMFALIAYEGPSEKLLLATVIIDNFTTAFSTVAFVSFLTLLTGHAFSASQYALLASLGNLGRTTLSSGSGYVADQLNHWPSFFILTAVMVIPSLLMLMSLKGYFNRLLQEKTVAAESRIVSTK